jgi:hypothetical protein
VRAVPHLCEFYPNICITIEEKARENLSQSKKNLSQVKKSLSQSTVYILPIHPQILTHLLSPTSLWNAQLTVGHRESEIANLHVFYATHLLQIAAWILIFHNF